MVSFNSPNIYQQSNTGIFIDQHIAVQAAADVTGYNIQYLRQMLRFGTLKGIKIGLFKPKFHMQINNSTYWAARKDLSYLVLFLKSRI
ncbi:MAG: hypothetical protein MUO67_01900 [Anaerolineales bacterium]|nr:hypothetical protein [Anaerolineales bacterium]